MSRLIFVSFVMHWPNVHKQSGEDYKEDSEQMKHQSSQIWIIIFNQLRRFVRTPNDQDPPFLQEDHDSNEESKHTKIKPL